MILRQFLHSDPVAISYLFGCGGRAAAAVVDPLGDTAPYLRIADETGMRIRYVIDTHLHADHISAGRTLAQAAGAEYVLFAEAAAILRLRDYGALRALGGLAPITKQSGKRRYVQMRRACNGRLRDAFYHWARTSTLADPASKSYYHALRQRGHSHGRALRSVADRWLRILMAMLTAGTIYDPTRIRPAAPAPLALAVAS